MPKKPRKITKLLAANRSEIAIRIFRGATELGLQTIGVYAEEDRFSVHRFKSDEAYKLNPEKGPVGAYLDIDGIVAIAKEHNADAIHPGYGFLSENPEFARSCIDNNLIFIGPSPEVLDAMGDKIAARAQAQKIGVPTLPGTDEPISDRDEALAVAREIGYPLIIKAAFGGGGRGMRVVNNERISPTSLMKPGPKQRMHSVMTLFSLSASSRRQGILRFKSLVTTTGTLSTFTRGTAPYSGAIRKLSRLRQQSNLMKPLDAVYATRQ